MQLDGKTALITGADSGIGQAVAAAFAREGAHVAVAYHTDEKGAAETRRIVEHAGRRAEVIQTDVGDPESAQAMFRQASAALGTLDVLVADAGLGTGRSRAWPCSWPRRRQTT